MTFGEGHSNDFRLPACPQEDVVSTLRYHSRSLTRATRQGRPSSAAGTMPGSAATSGSLPLGGAALGSAIGGSTGAVVGGAVGGATGAAVTTKGKGKTGAVVGGAVGGGAGAAVGNSMGGTTGSVVGAGVGGGSGAALGRQLTK